MWEVTVNLCQPVQLMLKRNHIYQAPTLLRPRDSGFYTNYCMKPEDDPQHERGCYYCPCCLFFFFYFFFWSFWASPAAYEGSQVRGTNGAMATALRQSHSNAESKQLLRPTLQIRAMLGP